MDDLDLEQLKQELNDVSGGSVYDVDEIMREAGSGTSKGSGTSLEELMKSLGVEMEEPKTQRMPQEEQKTELLKTRPVAQPEPGRTQPVGMAAPVTEDMMPELQGAGDLSALFLAAEQTQALVDEQAAMAEESKPEEETPFDEQDDVFAQLFARLGEIEQEEKPTDPRLTEPLVEPEEEPDLMARLFRPAEDFAADQPAEDIISEPAGTRTFESVLDSATRVIEREPEPVDAEPDVDAMETQALDEEWTQKIDAADTYDETEAYDPEDEPESEDEEEEAEDAEEKPRRSFFARLFGSAEEDEPDEEEDSDEEEESEDEYDEDDDASETDEEEESDEYDEEESEPEEDVDDTEDFDKEEEYEDSEETDEEEDVEEKPKRSFFARLFGSDEEDEEEADSDEEEYESEDEYDEAYEDDASDEEYDDMADTSEDEEDESEPEEDADDTEDFDEEEEYEDSEETDEEGDVEEKPKRGFFARLFGSDEEDEEETFDEEDESDEADESEDEYDEEYEGEEEYDSEDEEESEEEPDVAVEEISEAAEQAPVEAEMDLDETQAFDALSEQETQRIVLPSDVPVPVVEQPAETEAVETETIAEIPEEEESDDFGEGEEAEEPEETETGSEAIETEESGEENQPKQGFLNRLMDVFGLEIVEEEVEPEETDEAEPDAEEDQTEVPAEEMPSEETEADDGQWYDLEEIAEELPEEETAEDMESEPEAASETEPEEKMDPAEAEFRDILQREEEIGAEEETLSVPQPRPEDTPVISEEELAAFLADVEEEEEEVEKVSFEQLLRDNGIDVDAEPEEQKLSLEEFPEEETTVYVDVPIRVTSAEPQEDKQPELFDAEAEMEKEPERPADLTEPEPEEAEEPEEEPVEPTEEPEDEPEFEPDEEPEEEPEPDPDWMNLPLEELYRIAPSMAVLRREGPVMAREVLRQKEWIMARIRRYKDEQNGTPQPQEEPEEEPELPEPTEPSEDVDAIHAADELHALLEQDAAEDSVFPDGPTDKPETEAAGQKEIILEVTAAVRETEPEEDMEPETDMEPEEESEQPAKPAQAVSGQRKNHKPKAAPKPTVQIPKNLNQESKACRRRAGKQARRASAIAVLTLICIYISCAADFTLLPLPDAMNYVYHPANVLIVFLVLMGLSILLAYDVVRDGIQALLRLQPNLSTLIDLALVLNIVHCVTRLVSEGEEIPYACIIMLVLFAQLRAQVSRSTIQHYTYKVAGNAREPMGLFYHDGPEPHLVKAPLENTDAFIAQTLQRGVRQRAESIFAILSAVTAVVLAVIVCVATGDPGRLIYVLAATVTGACQIALICAMVMARSYSARRMQRSGAAADDNFGVQHLAKAETVVLTDEDLFPASSIALERLELRSNLNDATALAYAAALTGETSLGHMLAEEVRTRYGAPLVARHVVEDVNGGVSGQVGGIQVLLGDDRYMAEHGIIAREVPENGLVLALDGDVAAILVIDYQVPAALFNAMQVLTERKIHIWLHTRNHQITPKLVEQKYALKPGMVSIPKLETDRALRNPQYTAHDRLCGLLGRDGFIPLSGCITSAREEARVAPLGVIIGACAALLCMLLMTYLCYVFVPEDAHPIRVLIYMILCFIPIFFLENGIGKE